LRKFIVCLLIILLSACSNKKAPQNEGKVTDTAETEEYFFSEDETELYNYVHYNPLEDSRRIIVEASSELPNYPASNLVNGTWLSWAEGAQSNGIGESFTITWREVYYFDTVVGFALKNGCGDLNYYSQNNRVKSFKIYVDGEYIETIPIKDSISFEQYIFENPIVFRELRFVIDDVYSGTSFNNTHVAEIALLTETANTAQFYENILYWIKSSYGYYESNSRQIVSVPDTDRLLLMEYLPFNVLYNYFFEGVERWSPRITKIAFLNGGSSLKLNDNLPRLDGATAMYPLYSSFVRAVYPQINFDWEEKEGRKSYIYALYRWTYFPNTDLLEEYEFYNYRPHYDEEFGSIVQCNTTSRAFERLINGETDIIFCYEPSTAEINAAAEKGKSFSLTPIAYDAFVFIVNNRNILNNISQQQIRDIYSGKVTNWNSISGVDEPVIAYQRRENSGSQTILQSIMRGDRLIRPVLDGEFVPGGMGGMIRKITSDFYNYNSAIGYTFLFYLTQMADNSGVKALSVDGIVPTRQTIQNKTYPFVQTVYAITTGNRSENTRRFIEWILSAQGQELVAKTGYTPIR
jgi:phosphate transport system substrate-binding protein